MFALRQNIIEQIFGHNSWYEILKGTKIKSFMFFGTLEQYKNLEKKIAYQNKKNLPTKHKKSYSIQCLFKRKAIRGNYLKNKLYYI